MMNRRWICNDDEQKGSDFTWKKLIENEWIFF